MRASSAALVPSRAEFDRKAAFWAARFRPEWIAAVLAVIGASIWLGFFAFKHVEYSSELWWQFAVDRSAPRTLRASVGATMAILAFGPTRRGDGPMLPRRATSTEDIDG